MTSLRLDGAGLGFRRELLPALKTHVPDAINFFELAPENWIDMGGAYGRDLRAFTERYPFVCHGLSLSLGGPSPLDEMLLHKTRQFMDAHGISFTPNICRTARTTGTCTTCCRFPSPKKR